MVMKKSVLALAALLALSAGEITPAHAQRFDVGPGGVYVDRDGYEGYGRDRYRGSYRREPIATCGYWRQQCAENWGTGHMFGVCMQRRAAVIACGGY
jgi:hypothetical protein